jgi:hypothetical protein
MKRLAILVLLATGACGTPQATPSNVATPLERASKPLPVPTPTPVAAADFKSPKTPTPILLLQCHMGECGWEQITAIEDAEPLAGGILKKVTSRSGTTEHPEGADYPAAYRKGLAIAWQAPSEAYVLCSKTRPTEISWEADEKTYLVTTFDLADLPGYQVAGANYYMQICHALAPEKWSADDLKRLGYGEPVKSGQERIATLDAVRAYLR